MDESTTGGDAAVDTSSTGSDAGVVSDETGGVTAEEIAAALGPKYATVTPVKDDTKADKTTKDVEEDAAEELEEDEEEVVEPAKPTPEKPKEVVKSETADTKDFSITVEDAEGVTYKINTIEDLPEDFTPKNNRQIIQIIKDLSKAENDKEKYESEEANKAAETQRAEAVANIQKGWADEIKSLQADKRIPVTTKEDDNERVKEVFKFMAQENEQRMAAGRPTIGSFEDALDKLENREARKAKVEADKAAKEEARKNGALVGGSSTSNATTVKPYKAGSAKNINQALRAQGLI